MSSHSPKHFHCDKPGWEKEHLSIRIIKNQWTGLSKNVFVSSDYDFRLRLKLFPDHPLSTASFRLWGGLVGGLLLHRRCNQHQSDNCWESTRSLQLTSVVQYMLGSEFVQLSWYTISRLPPVIRTYHPTMEQLPIWASTRPLIGLPTKSRASWRLSENGRLSENNGNIDTLWLAIMNVSLMIYVNIWIRLANRGHLTCRKRVSNLNLVKIFSYIDLLPWKYESQLSLQLFMIGYINLHMTTLHEPFSWKLHCSWNIVLNIAHSMQEIMPIDDDFPLYFEDQFAYLVA